MSKKSEAYDELLYILHEDEIVESVIFGDNEIEPHIIPDFRREMLLTLEEAKEYMYGWSFYSGFRRCYPTYIWTNERIIFVSQFEGSTFLDCVPRNPIEIKPQMSGG